MRHAGRPGPRRGLGPGLRLSGAGGRGGRGRHAGRPCRRRCLGRGGRGSGRRGPGPGGAGGRAGRRRRSPCGARRHAWGPGGRRRRGLSRRRRRCRRGRGRVAFAAAENGHVLGGVVIGEVDGVVVGRLVGVGPVGEGVGGLHVSAGKHRALVAGARAPTEVVDHAGSVDQAHGSARAEDARRNGGRPGHVRGHAASGVVPHRVAVRPRVGGQEVAARGNAGARREGRQHRVAGGVAGGRQHDHFPAADADAGAAGVVDLHELVIGAGAPGHRHQGNQGIALGGRGGGRRGGREAGRG